MKSNSIFMKILMMLLIIATLNFSPCTYAADDDDSGGIIETMTTIVESIIVRLTLNLGDGLLYFVSKSVGEVVTIDKIVYNGVDKLNINYWDGGATTGVKTFFEGVINKWYKTFYKIAIMVYMAVLVFAGIQVLLNSTAEKSAKYKEYLVSWVTRSCYIMSFPICYEICS